MGRLTKLTPTTSSMNNKVLQRFREAFLKAEHVVVLAGAGLSAASGIPTFRGAGGLWRTYDAMSLATPNAFRENPSRVWQFYHYRRCVAGAAQPNVAHRAIAFFSTPEAMAQISPRLKSFRLVTQNVDGLSKRALPPSAVDDAQPFEMHGSVFRIQCTNCPYVTFDDHNPICPALGGTEDTVKDKAVEPAVLEKDLPHCPECQSLLRPGVVWFGEPVQYMGSTFNMLRNHCDLLLVVGTSSVVYPASSYAKVAREVGAQVAVFNIERTLGDDEADFVFLGPCEETLPEALLVQELIKPLL